MRLLLNVCCAPCALPLVEYLIEKEKPALFFYGPNIYPEEEYVRRLEATRKAASIYQMELFEGEYEHDKWLSFIKNGIPEPPESYPENGERCRACFKFRLDRTAAFATEKRFGAFAATLSVSRFKDTTFIDHYGEELADRYRLKYLTFPLDATEAHRRGIELSKKHNIYRQKYCGCEFSKK